jgi:hypothetical protein
MRILACWSALSAMSSVMGLPLREWVERA